MTEEIEVKWCVHDKNHNFLCKRCGEKHQLEMPISIDEYVRKSKAFIELHKNCKKS